MHTLIYNHYRSDGIFGRFYFNNSDIPFCTTLSHAFKQTDGSYAPIVLPGIYQCVLGTHALKNLIPFSTYEITGIPGHSGLLFHPGNWNRDSDGCTLLGHSIIKDDAGWMITMSDMTFKTFMNILDNVPDFILEVKDARMD